MPRLTTREYLRIHAQLGQFWDYDPAIFSYLTPTEQWILHDFFMPVGGLSEQQLLEHRAAIKAKRPALPQQAGRVLAKLYAKSAMLGIERVRAKNRPLVKAPRRRHGERVISVRAVVRPEIDAKKLARALIAVGRDIATRRREHLAQVALHHVARPAGAGSLPSTRFEMFLKFPGVHQPAADSWPEVGDLDEVV